MYVIMGESPEQFFGDSLDEAMKASVSENLRGWSPELRPGTNLYLPQYIVAGKYFGSARDVWWKYVREEPMKRTRPLLTGGLYHKLISEIIQEAKKYIYNSGAEPGFDMPAHMSSITEAVINRVFEQEKGDVMNLLRVSDINEIKDNMRKMWNYQAVQISASVNMVLSKFTTIDADALVSKAIPINVEQRLDGSRIGLSRQLSVDAMQVPHAVIMDVKTGKPHHFHKLTVAGYAMAYESEFKQPVNMGCIIYPQFMEGKSVPYIEKRFYVIDDSARKEFIEERDRKMRIILEGKPPGLPSPCPASCGYFARCHPSGKDERITSSQEPS